MSLEMLPHQAWLWSIVVFCFSNTNETSYSPVFLSISLYSEAIIAEGGNAGKQGSVFLKSEHFDPESLWRRLDHDRSLLREVVAVFAVEAPQLLARIEEGIRGNSAGDVKRASHKLKGSLLQFSARAAVATAQELEEKAEKDLVDGAAPLLKRLRHEVDRLREGLNSMAFGPPGGQKAGKGLRRGTNPRE